MKKNLATAVFLALCFGAGQSALAGDAELCLDCHEPAEDWEGMTAEEILAEAKDPSIKRHADNAELTDEQLQAMIAELLAE